MGATRLQVISENDRRARPVRQYQREENYDTPGSQCFKYILFYLFLTAVFVQVWVVVATSNNLPSIIITAILTFFAIIVLIWRHLVTYRRDQELRRNRIQQGTLQQQRSTIMLRPLGLSMRNIPEQSPDYSAGVSRILLMTLPTFTYTALVEDKEKASSTYSAVVKEEEAGLSEDTIVGDPSSSLRLVNDVEVLNNNIGGPRCPRSSTCIVCLVDYATGDELVLLPCNHEYHRSCIFTWLACHRLCPVCKQEVVIKPPTLSASGGNSVPEPSYLYVDSTANPRGTVSATAVEVTSEQHTDGIEVGINSTDLA